MKASEYALKLQALVEEHGDLDLWVASDEEGNSYNHAWEPDLGYVLASEADSWQLDSVHDDAGVEDMFDEDEEFDPESEISREAQLAIYRDENFVKVFVS